VRDKKEILGLIEKVKIYNPINQKSASLYALIDTGATSSSLDLKIAGKLNLMITGSRIIRSKTIITDRIIRPTVKAIVEIKGIKMELDTITIADRSNLTLPMIIGRDALYGRFIVDVSLTHKSREITDLIKKININEVIYHEQQS